MLPSLQSEKCFAQLVLLRCFETIYTISSARWIVPRTIITFHTDEVIQMRKCRATCTDISRRDFCKVTYHSLAVVGLLCVHALLLAYSATVHTPTNLEPAFIASGIYDWEHGRFEPYRVNPPLPRMLATVPIFWAGYELSCQNIFDSPGARTEFTLSSRFVDSNGPHTLLLLCLARWANISFSIIGGYCAYRWSRDLYGPSAGLLTLTLWAFEPNLLAHAELATPDSAGWSCGLMANYLFWRWLRSATWPNTIIAGCALGIAELTKFTWIMLYILWPLLWLVYRVQNSRSNSVGECGAGGVRKWWLLRDGMLILIMLMLSVNIINAGYAFRGTGTPLEDFPFVSQALSKPLLKGETIAAGNRFTGTWVGKLPVPLPRDYLLGLDVQKGDLEFFSQPSFLRGVWKKRGWWYYYIYGLGVKVPVGIWALLIYSMVARCQSGRIGCVDELIPASIGLAVLCAVSAHTAFNIHLRYAFPSLAIGLVLAGRAVCVRKRGLLHMIVLCLCVSDVIFGCLFVYPEQLSHFNWLAGGSSNGASHLRGSSIDWCQDIGSAIQFAREVADREGTPVYLDVQCSYRLSAIFPVLPAMVFLGPRPASDDRPAYVLRGFSLFPERITEETLEDSAFRLRDNEVEVKVCRLGLRTKMPYSMRLYYFSP